MGRPCRCSYDGFVKEGEGLVDGVILGKPRCPLALLTNYRTLQETAE